MFLGNINMIKNFLTEKVFWGRAGNYLLLKLIARKSELTGENTEVTNGLILKMLRDSVLKTDI